MEQDHYATLGVAPTADQAAIRSVYRALMRRYHPDADSSPEAAEQARAINQAYAVLGDPGKRARYDASLESRPPLRFDPERQVAAERKKAPIAPVLAVGVAFLAAGMVAFAIMPQPLPFASGPERDVWPHISAKPAEAIAAEPAIPPARKIALPPVAPKEAFAEPEAVELPEITPEPAMKPRLATATLNRAREPVVPVPPKAAAIEPAVTSSCPSVAGHAGRLMCADRNLASLDRQLTLLYRQSYSQADEPRRAALVGTRQRFNDLRNSCETSNCLTTAYVGRLKEISDIMAGRIQP